MNKIQSNFDIPQKDYGLICYMLYMRNDLNKIIKKRKDFMREHYINNMCITTNQYYRSYQTCNNTLENIIIKLNDDSWIEKYKKLHIVIKEYLNEIKEKSETEYTLIKLIFTKGIDFRELSDKFDLTIGTIIYLKRKTIYEIYHKAISSGVFEEVEVCRNVKL